MFAELPEIVGYAPWILTDTRSPLQWRWYNQGKAIKRHGLIDEYGRRKMAFDAVRNGIASLKAGFEAKPAAGTDAAMAESVHVNFSASAARAGRPARQLQ